MTHWGNRLQLSVDDPSFAVSEVSALLVVLEQHALEPESVLVPAGLHGAALDDAATRISLRQQYLVQKAAAESCGEQWLAIHWARCLRVTSYGMAGYALLSSESLGDAISVAEKYAPLLNMKFSLDLTVEGSQARIVLLDRYAMDDAMRRACAVLELAKLTKILRDLLGVDFSPYGARCITRDLCELEALGEFLGTRVEGGADTTELCFDAAWLGFRLQQAHATAHSACLQICDDLMEGLAHRFDLVHHVKGLMLNAEGRAPSLSEVADMLCVSSRTLRRRLEALNTSYNQILEDVRKDLAIRYLTTTSYSTEVIAELLGYSEAANFRHAFKRWTGIAPRQYCAARGILPTQRSRGAGFSFGLAVRGSGASSGMAVC